MIDVEWRTHSYGRRSPFFCYSMPVFFHLYAIFENQTSSS